MHGTTSAEIFLIVSVAASHVNTLKMQHRRSNLFLPAGLAVLLTFAAAGQQQDQLALKSRQAKSLLAQGRFADAIPLYEELVKALPGNPGLRLNLGIAEHMAGRDREAAA